MSVLICTISGIIIGYVYDFFRAIRKTSKYNTALTLISDLFFWIFAGGLTALSFFFIDGMNLRFYRFCAVFGGAILYFIIFSPFFLKVSEKILKIFAYFLKILFTIVKFCGKILNIVTSPILGIWKFYIRFSKKTLGKLRRFLKLKKRI